MRILVDIAHPAHVHFFRAPLARWRERGHVVRVTSRRKDCAGELLDALGIEHTELSARHGGLAGLALEMVSRDRALAREARAFRPDVVTAVGGTFAAHAGWLAGVPSVVFYDTEDAAVQNALTYPFASLVAVPRCYRGWLPPRHHRYPGYHELAYLAPHEFRPDRERALAAGLAPDGDTFLLRTVAWTASHDLGHRGLDGRTLRRVVDRLSQDGARVLVSAEGELPAALEAHRYRGPAAALHHLMAFCRGYVGDSATMASECAVLGVPALFSAPVSRGYVEEQEARFGLVRRVSPRDPAALLRAIDALRATPRATWAARRERLLDACCDVADHATELVAGYPRTPDPRPLATGTH